MSKFNERIDEWDEPIFFIKWWDTPMDAVSNPNKIACFNPNCKNIGIAKHHLKPAVKRTKRTKNKVIRLCKNCHKWVHVNYNNDELREKYGSEYKLLNLFIYNK